MAARRVAGSEGEGGRFRAESLHWYVHLPESCGRHAGGEWMERMRQWLWGRMARSSQSEPESEAGASLWRGRPSEGRWRRSVGTRTHRYVPRMSCANAGWESWGVYTRLTAPRVVRATSRGITVGRRARGAAKTCGRGRGKVGRRFEHGTHTIQSRFERGVRTWQRTCVPWPTSPQQVPRTLSSESPTTRSQQPLDSPPRPLQAPDQKTDDDATLQPNVWEGRGRGCGEGRLGV